MFFSRKIYTFLHIHYIIYYFFCQQFYFFFLFIFYLYYFLAYFDLDDFFILSTLLLPQAYFASLVCILPFSSHTSYAPDNVQKNRTAIRFAHALLYFFLQFPYSSILCFFIIFSIYILYICLYYICIILSCKYE